MNPKKLSFDTSYLTWKKWHSENFGILRKTEERYFSAELSRIPRKISCESAILEIGFGNGSFLKYALNRGWTVTGLEMNAELHKCAKASGFRSYCGGSLGIFQDSEFDFIFAFDVLEHIPHDELIGYFTEIRRILKSGGVFLARFPNGDSPFGMYNQNGDFTHQSVIGSGKIAYIANELGFVLKYIGGEAQPIYAGSLKHMLHRLIANPVKSILNYIVGFIFFPTKKVFFASNCLVIVLSLRD